jgi:hypothetical protein
MAQKRKFRGWRGEHEGGVGHVSCECLFNIAHFYLIAASRWTQEQDSRARWQLGCS